MILYDVHTIKVHPGHWPAGFGCAKINKVPYYVITGNLDYSIINKIAAEKIIMIKYASMITWFLILA